MGHSHLGNPWDVILFTDIHAVFNFFFLFLFFYLESAMQTLCTVCNTCPQNLLCLEPVRCLSSILNSLSKIAIEKYTGA